MKASQRSRGVFVLAACLITITSGTVSAATDEGAIQYRQKVMGAIGANMGAVVDMFKHKLPYGTERMAEHARLLQGNVAMISSAFKQQTGDGKTDAKPAIWQDWSSFEKKIETLQTELATFEKVVASGNPKEIGGQFRKVGGACKGCHDDFRKPKEESYKR